MADQSLTLEGIREFREQFNKFFDQIEVVISTAAHESELVIEHLQKELDRLKAGGPKQGVGAKGDGAGEPAPSLTGKAATGPSAAGKKSKPPKIKPVKRAKAKASKRANGQARGLDPKLVLDVLQKSKEALGMQEIASKLNEDVERVRFAVKKLRAQKQVKKLGGTVDSKYQASK